MTALATYRPRLGTYTPNGSGTDVLDALVERCQGEPMRLDRVGSGGETDDLAEGRYTSRDVHRLRCAGLVANGRGLYPDQLAHVAGWDRGVDEFVVWYLDTCIAGLAQRADARTGTAWEHQERPADTYDQAPEGSCTVVPADAVLPELVTEYLGRLIHGPKADYAAEYAYHVVHGAPAPSDPGAPWSFKARHRIDALVRRGGAR